MEGIKELKGFQVVVKMILMCLIVGILFFFRFQKIKRVSNLMAILKISNLHGKGVTILNVWDPHDFDTPPLVFQ